jgi:hypothetical protein
MSNTFALSQWFSEYSECFTIRNTSALHSGVMIHSTKDAHNITCSNKNECIFKPPKLTILVISL